MAKSTYAILDPIAREMHNVEDYLADVNEALGAFYPDNSRDGNADALKRYAEGMVAAAIALRDSLSTIRPDSGPGEYSGPIDLGYIGY